MSHLKVEACIGEREHAGRLEQWCDAGRDEALPRRAEFFTKIGQIAHLKPDAGLQAAVVISTWGNYRRR